MMRFISVAACLAAATATYAYFSPNGPSALDKAPPVPTSPPVIKAAAAGGSVQVQCAGTTQTILNGTAIPAVPDFSSIPSGDVNVDTLQCAFDAYSWNSFLALNHSASGSFGDLDGDNETLWETWAESSDIFLPGGAKPGNAGETPPRDIPEACQALGNVEGLRVIRQIGKHPDLLEESTQPFNSGPLIDTNGYYSRFAISVNPSMYDYIVDKALYSKSGQAAFSQAGNDVNFTCSCKPDASGTACSPEGQQGAMMVKAAWKVLDASSGDDPSIFHVADALIYTPEYNGNPATCSRQQMGLTGFHIGHKTTTDPQWLWSTFEHVANTPEQGKPQTRARYNYFQPDCDDCNQVNVPPSEPWDPHVQPVSANAGKSQIVREIPVTDDANTMNSAVQQTLLQGTVWENYHLISTQWPTNPTSSSSVTPSAGNGWCTTVSATDPTGAPAPTFLANTTLESYIQGQVPQASSNCISCHKDAAMTNGAFSDFTYLLERAQGDVQ